VSDDSDLMRQYESGHAKAPLRIPIFNALPQAPQAESRNSQRFSTDTTPSPFITHEEQSQMLGWEPNYSVGGFNQAGIGAGTGVPMLLPGSPVAAYGRGYGGPQHQRGLSEDSMSHTSPSNYSTSSALGGVMREESERSAKEREAYSKYAVNAGSSGSAGASVVGRGIGSEGIEEGQGSSRDASVGSGPASPVSTVMSPVSGNGAPQSGSGGEMRRRGGSVVPLVHRDAGRVLVVREGGEEPDEVPPTYESISPGR